MDVKDYEVVSEEKFTEMILDLASLSDENFAYLKLAEEMAEASEILIKLVTKTSDKKPSTLQLVEELGDVQARMAILAHKTELSKDIFDRARNKIHMLHEAFLEGKIGQSIVIVRK